MRNSILTIVFFTILFSLLSFSTAYAASINQIKGNKVLILLDGDSAQMGQEFYVINSKDKKIALIKITQIKGDKALGELIKGKAVVGGALQPKIATATPDSGESDSEENKISLSSKRKKLSGGILAGYAMNSMALTVQHPTSPTVKESVTLTDSSYSAKVFADYDLSQSWTIRAATGYETLAVKGSTTASICSNGTSKDCKASFDYLTLEGSLHYNFLTGNTRAWIGLGYAILFEMVKSSDIPNLITVDKQNYLILASTGVDFGLSQGKFIPLVLEYGIFPGSSSVTTNAIYVRVGYGFNF